MKRLITHNEALSCLPLRWKNCRWLGPLEDRFFLSFADTFRALMDKFNCTRGNILAPDFYCPETLNMYKNYGDLQYYQTNEDLTINIPSYLAAVKKYRPTVIINYGFLVSPFNHKKVESLLRELPEILIIEDCAHKILLEKDLVFAHHKHFYIDSIRKQTSLLGSHLIANQNSLKDWRFERVNWYKTKSTLLKTSQEVFNTCALLLQSKLTYFASEAIFEKLDSLIGTYHKPTLGGALSRHIWNRLDLQKMLFHKDKLINTYLLGLKNIQHKYFCVPPIVNKNITYFPCVVSSIIQDQFIEYLEKENIWAGTLWNLPNNPPPQLNNNLYQSVIVLPLTWEVSQQDAQRICRNIEFFFNNYPVV